MDKCLEGLEHSVREFLWLLCVYTICDPHVEPRNSLMMCCIE